MEFMGHLGQYPGLASWYAREMGRSATTNEESPVGPKQFVIRMCEALSQTPARLPSALADQLDVFINSSSNALNDYLSADAIIGKCDESLLNIISNAGETAVRSGRANRLFQAVSNAADKTGIAGLRFLSAWICLNVGDLERCVTECEKVDEPFASIYTILGQALLELKRPQQAAEALQVAVKLSPSEVLAWFQLAKAHYSTGNGEAAFTSLTECEKLAPNNVEIALFQAFIANELESSTYHHSAFKTLRPHLKRFSGDAEVVFNLLQLAIKTEDKSRLENCLQEIDFDQLRSDNRFPKLVSPFLRALYERNWMALSAKFLTGMTSHAS